MTSALRSETAEASSEAFFEQDAPVDLDSLRAAALRQIRNLVEFYRITPDELTGPAPALESATAPSPPPVKYRHPLTGDTWDGQGTHPEWLRKALLKEGYRVAELKVDHSTAF